MWEGARGGVDPGSRIRRDAGTRVSWEPPGRVGYLCGGSLEEGMEEPIAKVERWSLQGASCAHPEGGPDAERAVPWSRGGPGQQPASSVCSHPAAQALPSPASRVTRSLPQVLSPPSPRVSPHPPPHRGLLTFSPSSSWGLSASMPWRGETDGGGELGFGGGPEP